MKRRDREEVAPLFQSPILKKTGRTFVRQGGIYVS